MTFSRTVSTAALCVLLGGTLAACGSSPTDRSTGQVVDDSAITAKVKSKMLADRDVSGLDIKVETFRGTVQLSGFANSAAEVNRAVEIARTTDGVRDVKNDIRLKAGG